MASSLSTAFRLSTRTRLSAYKGPSLYASKFHRGFATAVDEHDVVIIGGGVAGYVAAIKAGQEGFKVRRLLKPKTPSLEPLLTILCRQSA